jgi:hypothetical protein
MLARSSWFRTSSRLRLLSVLSRLCLLLFVAASGSCRRDRGPALDVGVTPRYPCAGDSVTIAFSLQDVERMEVKDARGKVLAQSTRAAAVTIPNIEPGMLPLTATGWKGSDSRSERIPGRAPLAIIDGTITSEAFPLVHRLPGPDRRTPIGTRDCGCTLDDDNAPLLCENAAPVFDVSSTFEGQDAVLDSSWFSPRAHVVGVANETAWALSYLHNGNRILTLAPGASQAISFDSEVAPAGAWAARYDPDKAEVEYRGSYVDGGTVCSGWIHRRPEEVSRPLAIKLALRCME